MLMEEAASPPTYVRSYQSIPPRNFLCIQHFEDAGKNYKIVNELSSGEYCFLRLCELWIASH